MNDRQFAVNPLVTLQPRLLPAAGRQVALAQARQGRRSRRNQSKNTLSTMQEVRVEGWLGSLVSQPADNRGSTNKAAFLLKTDAETGEKGNFAKNCRVLRHVLDIRRPATKVSVPPQRSGRSLPQFR
jgi:hypothetical protein